MNAQLVTTCLVALSPTAFFAENNQRLLNRWLNEGALCFVASFSDDVQRVAVYDFTPRALTTVQAEFIARAYRTEQFTRLKLN